MPSSKTSSSPRCDAFVAPIRSFDVHCYFDAVGCPQLSSFTFLPHTCRLTTRQKDEKEVRFAEKLRQAIQQEFPELAVYKMHHSPIGPHPLAMFEVDVESPAQFGALIPWLAIRHGPLSILLHPNTGDARADHTLHATWIGERLSLDLTIFDRLDEIAVKLARVGEARDVEKTT